jgi:fumarate reductase subunit C
MSRNPHVREVSPTRWYFRHRRYWRYMAREVTSIFIGIFTIILLVGLERLSAGPAQYEAFLAALQSSGSVIFLSLTLAFSLYNTFTWFNVAPKALPLQFGDEMAPDSVVRNAHYAIWIGLTLLILWGAY